MGKDGWLYFSIGSTGNVSAEDRDADPQRAAILRVRPGGGAPQVYARGVRNGTGLAVDPDGAVWTAVNNRDNIAYPYNRDYDGDGSPDRGQVLQAYVNDHPLEPLARLTPGSRPRLAVLQPGPRRDARRARTRAHATRGGRSCGTSRRTPTASKLDCAALPPVEQGMRRALGAARAELRPRPGTAGALRAGRAGRGPRLVEPQPAPAAGGGVLPLARRDARPAADPARRVPARDGVRWGRPVMAVPGPGPRHLRHRRRRRGHLPDDSAVLTLPPDPAVLTPS